MSETILSILRMEFADLMRLAVPFVTLAYLTKRSAMLSDFRKARPEIVTNLVLLLINAAVLAPLVTIPVLAGRSLIPRSEGLMAVWSMVPALATVIAAILLLELAAYWRHRLEHTRTFWPIHATHHADEALNWLSVRRKHPLGELLGILCDSLPVIALGLPFWAIGVAFVIRGWWGYFVHADVPWTLGPLGKVLISPAAHRLHHIRDEKLMGYNFGNMVTIWDQLFGTYKDPGAYLNCETGIAEGTRDALGELLRPFEPRYWRRQRTSPV